MRLVASGLLSLVCLLSALVSPAHADTDLVVDDEAQAVQIKGTWATASATSGFIGNGYHYRVAGEGSSTVAWSFPGQSGRYEVFARWTSGTNRASNATYAITSAEGVTS